MDSEDSFTFKVDRLPHVIQQIRELADRANATGKRDEFLASLKSIHEKLKATPGEWGEPVYHPKVEGSTVRRGATSLLLVRYVVFESHRLVVVLDVSPMPKSGLE